MHIVNGLIDDHNHILEVLEVIPLLLDKLRRGLIKLEDIERVLNFLSTFTDSCHHGKRRANALSTNGGEEYAILGGPIYVIVCEHGVGRCLLRNAKIALERLRRGDSEAINDLSQYIGSYRELLVQHIAKGNNVLFPMARQRISEGEGIEEAEEMEKRFNHEAFLKELEKLVEIARS